jgi:uracil phosphoribosyltransferase/phosphoserine phosphatase/adenylate kinase
MATSNKNNKQAIVVGIYGIQGCGKTYLLNQLKQSLGHDHFSFYDGSTMIAELVPGGISAFLKLSEEEKLPYRHKAISTIGQQSSSSGKVAIVTGHLMFWPEGEVTGKVVCTQSDWDTYTHILYLDSPAEDIAQRRSDDKERHRPAMSADHLRKWQEEEKTELRKFCYQHGILFSIWAQHSELLDKVSTLLHDFRHHDEEHNLSLAKRKMDEIVALGQGKVETMLVMDADRTLAAQDSGALFWKMVSDSRQSMDDESPLKTLFNSPLGYSYTAFRQAALLYGEMGDEQEFDALCERVASTTTMHTEFVTLLNAARQEHVGMVVVTCGLRRVWEKVLERTGLSETVKVIGGGRISEGFVVTPAVKAAIVSRLREIHHLYVWAFGDSPLDLPMLRKADQAIVIVIGEEDRSKTMDAELLKAIDNDGLSARQALLPRNVSPRLDATRLPVVRLTNPKFVASMLLPMRSQQLTYCQHMHPLRVLHATHRNASKLLMTPMRDAMVSGPALQGVHRRVGWYLATEFLTELIGMESYLTTHVLGHSTAGFRLRNERQTSIVALMRGGEPMALGVNDAFPLAMFIHAKNPTDIQLHHLLERRTIILVDSVVNSGKSVVEFVQYIRGLDATIRIVVVAGVVQADSVDGGSIAQILERDENFSLVALRLSDTKFTGKGTTDTGNRLFNTTQLD